MLKPFRPRWFSAGWVEGVEIRLQSKLTEFSKDRERRKPFSYRHHKISTYLLLVLQMILWIYLETLRKYKCTNVWSSEISRPTQLPLLCPPPPFPVVVQVRGAWGEGGSGQRLYSINSIKRKNTP